MHSIHILDPDVNAYAGNTPLHSSSSSSLARPTSPILLRTGVHPDATPPTPIPEPSAPPPPSPLNLPPSSQRLDIVPAYNHASRPRAGTLTPRALCPAAADSAQRALPPCGLLLLLAGDGGIPAVLYVPRARVRPAPRWPPCRRARVSCGADGGVAWREVL